MRPLTTVAQTDIRAGTSRQLPHHDLLTYVDQNNLTPDFYTYVETLTATALSNALLSTDIADIVASSQAEEVNPLTELSNLIKLGMDPDAWWRIANEKLEVTREARDQCLAAFRLVEQSAKTPNAEKLFLERVVCPIPTFLDREYTVLTKRSLLAAPSFGPHKPLPAPTKLADLRTKGGKFEMTFKIPIRPVKTRDVDENAALDLRLHLPKDVRRCMLDWMKTWMANMDAQRQEKRSPGSEDVWDRWRDETRRLLEDLPRPVTPPLFPHIPVDRAIIPENYAELRHDSLHSTHTASQPELLEKLLIHDPKSSPSAIIESLKSSHIPCAPPAEPHWQSADPMAMTLLDEFDETFLEPLTPSSKATHTPSSRSIARSSRKPVPTLTQCLTPSRSHRSSPWEGLEDSEPPLAAVTYGNDFPETPTRTTNLGATPLLSNPATTYGYIHRSSTDGYDHTEKPPHWSLPRGPIGDTWRLDEHQLQSQHGTAQTDSTGLYTLAAGGSGQRGRRSSAAHSLANAEGRVRSQPIAPPGDVGDPFFDDRGLNMGADGPLTMMLRDQAVHNPQRSVPGAHLVQGTPMEWHSQMQDGYGGGTCHRDSLKRHRANAAHDSRNQRLGWQSQDESCSFEQYEDEAPDELPPYRSGWWELPRVSTSYESGQPALDISDRRQLDQFDSTFVEWDGRVDLKRDSIATCVPSTQEIQYALALPSQGSDVSPQRLSSGNRSSGRVEQELQESARDVPPAKRSKLQAIGLSPGSSLDRLLQAKSSKMTMDAPSGLRDSRQIANDFFKMKNVKVGDGQLPSVPMTGSETLHLSPALSPPVGTAEDATQEPQLDFQWRNHRSIQNPMWYTKAASIPAPSDKISVLASMSLVQNRALTKHLNTCFALIERDKRDSLQGVDLVLSSSTGVMVLKISELVEKRQDVLERLRVARKYYRRVIVVIEVVDYALSDKRVVEGRTDDVTLGKTILEEIPRFKRAIAGDVLLDADTSTQIELVFAVNGAAEVAVALRNELEEEFVTMRATIGDEGAWEVCEKREWLEDEESHDAKLMVLGGFPVNAFAAGYIVSIAGSFDNFAFGMTDDERKKLFGPVIGIATIDKCNALLHERLTQSACRLPLSGAGGEFGDEAKSTSAASLPDHDDPNADARWPRGGGTV